MQVLQRAMEAVEIHHCTHLERIEGILLKSGGDGFLIKNETFKDELHKTKLVNIVNDQLWMDTEHYLRNK